MHIIIATSAPYTMFWKPGAITQFFRPCLRIIIVTMGWDELESCVAKYGLVKVTEKEKNRSLFFRCGCLSVLQLCPVAAQWMFR